jgi:2-polyprenyl-3-methyl-5-hydroxy-6-metoxy-1,4-benzoquinol methylase
MPKGASGTGDYHKYVFDVAGRRMVGDFEQMYRDEDVAGFDSWHERDLRPLRKTIALQLLSRYNYNSILEVGCGKGTLTHLLKRQNNRVVGVDISDNAIAKAKASYPDIDFRVMTAEQAGEIKEAFDITVVMGVFAYVEQWKDCLAKYAAMSTYGLVAEFVPSNAIGFVKSIEDLTRAFDALYAIENRVVIDDTFCLLFGKSRK